MDYKYLPAAGINTASGAALRSGQARRTSPGPLLRLNNKGCPIAAEISLAEEGFINTVPRVKVCGLAVLSKRPCNTSSYTNGHLEAFLSHFNSSCRFLLADKIVHLQFSQSSQIVFFACFGGIVYASVFYSRIYVINLDS